MPCSSHQLSRAIQIAILLGSSISIARSQPEPAWIASTVVEQDAGIWTVKSIDLFAEFAGPELIGLDDKGRCFIAVHYSGRWTILETLAPDGEWLGAVQAEDLDPRRPGRELYTGGKSGRLYQLWPRPRGGFDVLQIADFPAEEIHTIIATELDRSTPGPEMLVFARSGMVAAVRYTGEGLPGFTTTFLPKLPGRVRDYLLLEEPGADPTFLTVSRAGILAEVSYRDGALQERIILEEAAGFGRLSRAPQSSAAQPVVYATRDDGLILRLERQADRSWRREAIYAGPTGPRGIAAGRFHEDPKRESVAVFGYGAKVQLLTRGPDGRFAVDEIFRDSDKGHWLTITEQDGTNATDEIVISGYSNRITMLARPAGFGLPGLAIDPKARDSATVLKVGVAAGPIAAEGPNPRSYRGGFLPKTLCFETLVHIGADREVQPGLAASWTMSADGRTYRFALREGARWSDGQPVLAEEVRASFAAWLGEAAHDWLPMNRNVESLRVIDARTIEFQLREPMALLPQLGAVNPCAVVKPASDPALGFVGTGSYRFVGAAEGGRVLQLEPRDERLPILHLTRYADGSEAALLDFAEGSLDAVISGFDFLFHGPSLAEAQARRDARRTSVRSTSTFSLELRGIGRTEDPHARRAWLAAIDRAALVQAVLAGAADAIDQPQFIGSGTRLPTAEAWQLVVDAADPLEQRVAAHLARAAQPMVVEIVSVSKGQKAEMIRSGAADAWISRSYGGDYEPLLSLRAAHETGPAGAIETGPRAELKRLTQTALKTTDPKAFAEVLRRIDQLSYEAATSLPLFAPRQIALHTAKASALQPLADPNRITVLPLSR